MIVDKLNFIPQDEQSLEVFIPQTEKEKQWLQMEHHLRKVKDTLGMPIDGGIFETVVALNALRINTIQSCEGHTNWGAGAPWVDLQAPNIEQLHAQLRHIVASTKDQNSRDQLSNLIPNPKVEILQREIKKQNLEERRKVQGYLSEFYHDRDVPYDLILILQPMGLFSRLQSNGADFQELNALSVKQEKLYEYQHEMETFGTFLKGKFFSG